MKKHSFEENEYLDELTTDSTPFRSGSTYKEEGSNINYKYNKTPVKDFN